MWWKHVRNELACNNEWTDGFSARIYAPGGIMEETWNSGYAMDYVDNVTFDF